MKIALMACSDNPEIIWNAFRMGNLMLEKWMMSRSFCTAPPFITPH